MSHFHSFHSIHNFIMEAFSSLPSDIQKIVEGKIATDMQEAIERFSNRLHQVQESLYRIQSGLPVSSISDQNINRLIMELRGLLMVDQLLPVIRIHRKNAVFYSWLRQFAGCIQKFKVTDFSNHYVIHGGQRIQKDCLWKDWYFDNEHIVVFRSGVYVSGKYRKLVIQKMKEEFILKFLVLNELKKKKFVVEYNDSGEGAFIPL